MDKFLDMLKSEYAQLVKVVHANMKMKDKLMLMFKNKFIIGIFLVIMVPLFFIVVGSTGGHSIDIVKSGILKIDKSVTVGNAIDNYKYFSSASWKEFEDDQKRNVVEFNGKIKTDAIVNSLSDDRAKKILGEIVARHPNFNKGALVRMQFLIDADSKSFKLGYSSVNFNGQNTCENKIDIIEDIYRNSMISCLRASMSRLSDEVDEQVEKERQVDVLKQFIKNNKNSFIGKYHGTCHSEDYDLRECDLRIIDITENDLKINLNLKISINKKYPDGVGYKPVDYSVSNKIVPIRIDRGSLENLSKTFEAKGTMTGTEADGITYITIKKAGNSNPTIEFVSSLTKNMSCNPINFQKYD